MLPELNVVLSQEGGCPDVSLATFDEARAWADYHGIIKGADDVADEEGEDGENETVEIDGTFYRIADQYGDPHARIFGVKVEVGKIFFGEYFQAVMSCLVAKHGWSDPYASISPVHHDGRWLDMTLNGYLTSQTTEATAAVIHANSTNGDQHV
jgi:hypothetical protein